jgi:hypothetical protein
MRNDRRWISLVLCGLLAAAGCGPKHLASPGSVSQLGRCVATWNRPENYLRPALARLTNGPLITHQRASVQYDDGDHICVYSARWYERGGGPFGGDYWSQDLIAYPGHQNIASSGPEVVGGTFSGSEDDPDYDIPASNASVARNGTIALTDP